MTRLVRISSAIPDEVVRDFVPQTDIESMKISSLTDWCTYKLLLEAQFAEVKVDPGRSDSMFKSIKGLYTLLDAATQVAQLLLLFIAIHSVEVGVVFL